MCIEKYYVVNAHKDGHVYKGKLPIGQLAFPVLLAPAVEAVEMLTFIL